MSLARIKLPEPCPVAWGSMTPASGGRFCDTCEKTVIDFSKMDAEEIAAYFKAHAYTGFCGNFALHQVETPKSKKEQLLGGWYRSAQHNIGFAPARWLTLLLLGSLLVLSGCRTRTGGVPRWSYEPKQGHSAPGGTR